MTDPLITAYLASGPTLLGGAVPSFVPTPNTKDYELGEFVRYFAQQTNQPHGDITEVSRQSWLALQSVSLYRTVSLRWHLTGLVTFVARVNEASVRTAAKTISTIGDKLTNPLQLYRT